MLPLPNLDNKTYQQLFDEGVKLIHKYFPGWTDENFHDPGITFIELLSWLVEMQQYYLNEITEKSYYKFLKLLGINPLGFEPSRVAISFLRAQNPEVIIKGTKLYIGEIPFEIEEKCHLLTADIEKVLVKSSVHTFDYTESNISEGISFYAFGEDMKKGNSLYIGFRESLPQGIPICLYFNLFEDYPVKRIPITADSEKVFKKTFFKYQFYGVDDKSSRETNWSDFELILDKTYGFTQSGKMIFEIPGEMSKTKIFPANDGGRYWICFTLEEEKYELPPRITTIKTNTFTAIQKETICELNTFSGKGEIGERIELNSYLSCFGTRTIQVKQEGQTWVDWQEPINNNSDQPNSKQDKSITLIFGKGKEELALPKGKENVRVISFFTDHEQDLYIGASNGLNNQTFQLPYFPVLKACFLLQVGIKSDQNRNMTWEDWTCVEDLDSSRKEDRHYTLDESTGEIAFGDNTNGMIPPASKEKNIRIISFAICFGERGNIGKNLKVEMPKYLDGLNITDVTYQLAVGGRNQESLEDVMIRFQKEQKQISRAVTAKDFEEIALNTKGVRIARVKAIPYYFPGMNEYEKSSAASKVTVVAVPYGESSTPVPREDFLNAIRRHLEKYRQITTEVYVTGPQYIRISIHAEVVGFDGKKVNKDAIIEKIKKFITPFDSGSTSKGWQFGRSVYKSDIYSIIKAVDDVAYVKELWIDADGSDVTTNNSGDIIIPCIGLVYSGQHEIKIIKSEI